MKEFKITVLGRKHQEVLFVGTEKECKAKAEELLENNRSVFIEILDNSHFKTMGRRRFSKIVKQNGNDCRWYGVEY